MYFRLCYWAACTNMSEESQPVILLPRHLAEAIEWVLRPNKDKKDASPKSAPDLSRLTSDQLQLLPLHVAQAFMDLSLAALQPKAYRTSAAPAASAREMWVDARAKQRARRAQARVHALAASHQRLYAWYVQTGSARQRGFAS